MRLAAPPPSSPHTRTHPPYTCSPLMSVPLQVQELDARSLKRLAAALDKRAAENLQLRAKHAGDPMK